MPEVNLNQSTQTTQPPQKPERNWKKILLILLIALFVISLLGVGLYLLIPRLTEGPTPITQPQKQATPSAEPATPSAKKDETEGWETFTSIPFNNKEYKYSLKHPPNIKIFDIMPGRTPDTTTAFNLILTNQDLTQYQPGAPLRFLQANSILLKIDILDKPNSARASQTFKELVQITYGGDKTHAKSITQLKLSQFAGKTAYTYEMTGESGNYLRVGHELIITSGPLKVIRVENNGAIFDIVYKPNNIEETILSTFKFLSSTSSE